MSKFLRLIIMAVILLGFNFKVHAELVVESNGRVRVSTGGFNQNGVRTWRYLDNGRGGMGGNMFYHENSSKSLAVRHASTGFKSASTVPVTIEAQVSRKAVLSGAFKLVKSGAALGSRLSGWGTAAYFAYEAYQAVKSDLEFEGYEYNKEQQEFLKYYDNALCLNHKQPCLGVDSSVMRAISKGGKSREEAGQLLSMQVTPLFRSYFEKYIKPEYPDRYFDSCFFMYGAGVVCELNTGTRYLFNFENNGYSDTLTEEKFLQISTPSIDRNPTPFVEGAGKPQYQENIKVPSGTVVTIGPVETPEGKKTYTVTFTNPTNGGSSEAPLYRLIIALHRLAILAVVLM